MTMGTNKMNRYDYWLKELDAWRNKFTTPLTRKQACEVLIDDSKFENGEFIEPKMKDMLWNDYESFICKYLMEK